MIEQLEKQPKWNNNSILLKSAIITVIVLVLLIPSAWIQGLVTERQGYQADTVNKIVDKWSGNQLIQGPVLKMPYIQHIAGTDANKNKTTRDEIKILYVMPRNIQFKADVKTELFENGIYDAVGYNSKVAVNGTFDKHALDEMNINQQDVMFDKAELVFGISDLKGLKDSPVVKIQGHDYNPEPALDDIALINKGLKVAFQMPKEQVISFSYILDIKGSNELNFLNSGKATDIEVKSDWGHPGFNGRFLPDSHTLFNNGFSAKWHLSYYNRPFPQQWTGSDSVLTAKIIKDAVVGIKMQLPIDQYRKVLRTTKYATLIIFLTFVSLFMTELIKKQNIHLFNYVLIGAAMVVYYTLLLSFSEQIGFNLAYLISSISTISLISVFTGSLLKNRGAAALFALILGVFYGFIFVIIQLEALSLLFGSIALFIIVALLMFFSRKINWDNH